MMEVLGWVGAAVFGSFRVRLYILSMLFVCSVQCSVNSYVESFCALLWFGASVLYRYSGDPYNVWVCVYHWSFRLLVLGGLYTAIGPFLICAADFAWMVYCRVFLRWKTDTSVMLVLRCCICMIVIIVGCMWSYCSTMRLTMWIIFNYTDKCLWWLWPVAEPWKAIKYCSYCMNLFVK